MKKFHDYSLLFISERYKRPMVDLTQPLSLRSFHSLGLPELLTREPRNQPMRWIQEQSRVCSTQSQGTCPWYGVVLRSAGSPGQTACPRRRHLCCQSRKSLNLEAASCQMYQKSPRLQSRAVAEQACARGHPCPRSAHRGFVCGEPVSKRTLASLHTEGDITYLPRASRSPPSSGGMRLL